MGLFDYIKPEWKAWNADTTVDVKDAIRERRQYDGYEDCTPCRLMGSTVFVGLGAYTLWSGRKQLHERRAEILKRSRIGLGARYASIYALSASLVGLGVYRMYN